MSHFPSDEIDECGCGEGCMACPVTPERRAWWAEAQSASMAHPPLSAGLLPLSLAEHTPNCTCMGCHPELHAPVGQRGKEQYERCAALFGEDMADVFARERQGHSLYDALYPEGDPEWDAFEAECAARAAHREANAAFYREQEEKSRLALQQRRIEEKVADESKMRLNREQLKSGVKLEKKACPCARLYSCVGDKSTGGAKPTTRHVTSECWSHERKCPETGAMLKPHKCPWLHPGEPGWRAEWNTNRLFKPAVAPPPPPPAQHRMAAALGGGGGGGFHRGGGHQSGYPPRAPSGPWRPQPQPSRPQKPAQSRFGTFEDSSEEEGDRSAW